MQNNCTLLVMSCDKYESAWVPYFQLLKKYWPQHPQKIILCTETKTYTHELLNIKMANSSKNTPWSDRLIQALSIIDTKYVVFSLEDFFLQAPVKQDTITHCYKYMETHPNVAQCRFKNCDNKEQINALGECVFPNFYKATSEVIFRLDTQFALWNKEWFKIFLVSGENPWQFETVGTKRIQNTTAEFIWYHTDNNPKKTNLLIFPYQMALSSGYGISMGHWLWKNEKLFKKNEIYVDMSELGVISKFRVKYNLLVNKAVYQKCPKLQYRIFSLLYRLVNKAYKIHNEWKSREK